MLLLFRRNHTDKHQYHWTYKLKSHRIPTTAKILIETMWLPMAVKVWLFLKTPIFRVRYTVASERVSRVHTKHFKTAQMSFPLLGNTQHAHKHWHTNTETHIRSAARVRQSVCVCILLHWLSVSLVFSLVISFLFHSTYSVILHQWQLHIYNVTMIVELDIRCRRCVCMQHTK